MDLTKRIALALGILVLDAVLFFLPVTAIFLAYVLIFNPPWFRQFINRLEPPGY
jgi:uncharacterized membrane protein